MLIGLIPLCFLIYLTFQVYHEKTEKLQLFENYQTYIDESANINGLIDALQEERKFSFDYAMTKTRRRELVLQRPRTDAYLQKLLDSNDPALIGFTNYTKLGELSDIRKKIDTFGIGPDLVMHFYSNTVFRLNTLNTLPPANTAYLKPIYKDLMAQKILSEMMTYLGIIRSNIYNVLHTRLYMVETLFGTIGAHDMYNSYESEFLAKATPQTLKQYQFTRDKTALKPTVEYMDELFKTFRFNESYTAAEWWKVSDEGTNELRKFQNRIRKDLNKKLDAIYHQEEMARNWTLLFLIIALISVAIIVCYIVFIISRSLKELQLAAEKISNGETGVTVNVESHDAIGSLALCIRKIDENNRALAHAATEIGKENFNIDIEPRSEKDILGNAIIQMKKELEQYSQKMEMLVAQRTEELARSNDDLQQFAHVASHDLKEPMRKIATFSNILNNTPEQLSEKGKLYLAKIEIASNRMSNMIEDILAYSTLNANEHPFEIVDLNNIITEIENDLELVIIQKEVKIHYEKLPPVKGIPLLLYQLFYNLVNNAIKFAKEDTPPIIQITSEMTTKISGKTGRYHGTSIDYVHITISDNGIGFNQQYAEQMFSVFTRLNAKDAYEGTGLGLALCRKIVQRHNGEIYAEGEEGKGSKFHVLLPANNSQ